MPIKMQEQKMPSSPGVYFFKKDQKILYVGKAANLRARLRSYLTPQPPSPYLPAETTLQALQAGQGEGGKREISISLLEVRSRVSPKTQSLLKESTKLDWQVLNSETEALIKESELIKKYQPKYNILMRDDKQYFFVAFTKETYPKIHLTHRTPKGPEYIGPFSDGNSLKSVLKLLRRTFPYCTCKRTHKNLCLNAKIGRCPGFCCFTPTPPSTGLPLRKGEKLPIFSPLPLTKGKGGEGVRGYRNNISSIKKILTGKNKTLLKTLKKEMKKLSREQRYEEAGKIRDQIKSLKKIFAHKEILSRDMLSENIKAISSLESLLKIKNINRIEAYDIANILGKHAYGSMAVFVDGAPAKDLYRIFKIKTVAGSNDVAMLKEVITRRFLHKEWQYPDVILVDGGKQQMNVIQNLSPQPPLLTKERGRGGKVKVIALTKDPRHHGDHIYISNQKSPLPLDSLPSPLKNLLLHLDSEAHRFAIKHYRQSHRKTIL